MSTTMSSRCPDNTARLFRDYGAKVRRWAIRFVGSSSDADDIVQEVFLAAYKNCQINGDLIAPGPWLLKATSNMSRHFWRTKGRQARRELSCYQMVPAREETTPLEQVEARCAAGRLNKAIANLDPRYANIYMLFEIQRLPSATIAALTGMRPTSLRVLRFRARSAVARNLALMEAADDRIVAQARTLALMGATRQDAVTQERRGMSR